VRTTGSIRAYPRRTPRQRARNHTAPTSPCKQVDNVFRKMRSNAVVHNCVRVRMENVGEAFSLCRAIRHRIETFASVHADVSIVTWCYSPQSELCFARPGASRCSPNRGKRNGTCGASPSRAENGPRVAVKAVINGLPDLVRPAPKGAAVPAFPGGLRARTQERLPMLSPMSFRQ